MNLKKRIESLAVFVYLLNLFLPRNLKKRIERSPRPTRRIQPDMDRNLKKRIESVVPDEAIVEDPSDEESQKEN